LTLPTSDISEGAFAVATDASGQQSALVFGSSPHSPLTLYGLTAIASSYWTRRMRERSRGFPRTIVFETPLFVAA
jgi:hypothetical protein